MKPDKNRELQTYKLKRDFEKTPEPGPVLSKSAGNRFVIQRHRATTLHYDFRLEADGVLKSWAVTKEPPNVPGVKRLAVMTEDHPTSYIDFSGTIPEGQYGAGTVEIWDLGTYEPLLEGKPDDSLTEGIERGAIKFKL
ncbi:MAG: ATP-dependent DNA ligase, partial [Actinobacteria bacterium]|nr:ATP-dependent DNA ligase [Actinomycetota bacterium]